MPHPLAERLNKLPPYLFAEIDKMKQAALDRGEDVINLGVGDPDLPTPDPIIDRLAEAARDPANHQYPSYTGMMGFREAAAAWFERRFGASLDPATEVLTLIGSKEGIFHFPLAFIDPGDTVLVPDPAYPVYHAGAVFAEGNPIPVPLLAENDFFPDLDAIDPNVAKAAKILWVNYPNNPTASCATLEFLEKVVDFAQKHQIIVAHDMAYSEIAYDGYRPPSLLQVPGGKEVSIEFHSLSKTYNMTGWRIAFAVGNRDLIAGLGAVKTNADSGQFQPIQIAGITALEYDHSIVDDLIAKYKERRDVLVDGLNALGWNVPKPKASFYVWIPCPDGRKSTDLTAALLQHAAIVTTPGVGFGQHGEGYIRMTLCTDKSRLEEAVARIEKLGDEIRSGPQEQAS